MEDDLRDRGTFRRSTAALMWTAYVGHAGATMVALTRRPALPLPGAVARSVGALATGAGAALCLAGSSRFAGAGELAGTITQPLVTGGIYRHTRNPQYLGYMLALAGLAVARRSTPAMGLAAFLGVTYAAWVPVEEEHLTRTLGEPYATYQKQTHRWWGHR